MPVFNFPAFVDPTLILPAILGEGLQFHTCVHIPLRSTILTSLLYFSCAIIAVYVVGACLHANESSRMAVSNTYIGFLSKGVWLPVKMMKVLRTKEKNQLIEQIR